LTLATGLLLLGASTSAQGPPGAVDVVRRRLSRP